MHGDKFFLLHSSAYRGRFCRPCTLVAYLTGISQNCTPCVGEKLYPSRLGEYLVVLVPTEMFTQVIPASGEAGFDPSGCGGHKNSENVATFSEFLGREEKPSLPAHQTSLGRRKNLFPCWT